MKQTTTTLNGHTILMVEVPEGVTHMLSMFDRLQVDWMEGREWNTKTIALLPGKWDKPILASDITEEIAAGLVEWWELAGKKGWREYVPDDIRFPCKTAIASLHSFLKANNFNPETTVILIKE